MEVESSAVARPRPIRLPVPVADQILLVWIPMASVTLMRTRRFHPSPNRGRGMSGCQKALAPLHMDGLYSAIASAAAGASDLASSAATAASQTAAQATASTPTAMESIIQTGAASAAAALFGSTDAVTPPKTLALGSAWRDALCPAHRERTDLPGGARSKGLAMIVAACARIESTSAPRRAALQRLVRLAASE